MSDELAKALRALQKAADVVQQKGACTGSEWVRLSAAQLSASAALTAYEAQAKAPQSNVDKTLAELDALHAKATSGEWAARETRVYMRPSKGGFDLRGCPDAEGNAHFIAAIKTAYPALRSHIASLVQERDRWKLQSDDWQKRGWELGNQLDAAQAEAARMREALKDLLETAVEPDTDSELYHCNLKRKAARAALNPETPANG